jgi:hypothetical protein
LGSSHDALLYQGSVSRGFVPSAEQTLLASASIAGQYADGASASRLFGVDGKYYVPQGKRWLFYAAASGDMLTHPDVLDMLLLGGDNGLRGYPLRYQAGDKRALLTLEERLYANAFVWNLFRVGAAAFVDVGRAWGGPHVNSRQSGLACRCRHRPAHLERARVDEGRAPHRPCLPAQRQPTTSRRCRCWSRARRASDRRLRQRRRFSPATRDSTASTAAGSTGLVRWT